MSQSYFLDSIKILQGPEKLLRTDSALIIEGRIKAFGQKAHQLSKKLNIKTISDNNLVLAPCLVDPHSILEDHLNGKVETVLTLCKKAAAAGYGQIALLPRSTLWRDKPENMQSLISPNKDILIHLWGSFSQGGNGEKLTSHKDLINYGAIGIADDDSIPPTNLLIKGILLNEINGKPLLIAPRDKLIQGSGLLREGVESLRTGWHQDPITSETIPLRTLLEIHNQYPEVKLRLMNMSTSAGISILDNCSSKPMATVSWWHLVADQSSITSSDVGIRVSPSLGGPGDREALIDALLKRTLTGVSVHNISLDDAEIKKPPAERIAGLSGYHLVLPSLWQELVEKSKCSIEELWEAISFGPSKILDLPPEELKTDSNRWLLFDPNKKWVQTNRFFEKSSVKVVSNQPWGGREITGKVIDCGLISH